MRNPLLSLSAALRYDCVLAVLPPTGTYRDWSPQSQSVYLENASSLKWIRGSQDGVLVNGTAAIRVSDHTSLRLTTGTAVVGFPEPATYSGLFDRFIDKYESAVAGFGIFFNGTSNISLAASVTSSMFVSWEGSHTVAVSFESGEAPDCYLDSIYQATGSSAVTVGTGSGDLSLGNRRSEIGANRPLNKAAHAWLLFHRPLTTAEHAEVHAFLVKLRSPRRIWQCGCLPPPVKRNEPDVLAAWDLGVVAAGTVEDRSANGNDCTLAGQVTSVNTATGPALDFRGGNGNAGNVPIPTGDFSVECTFNARTAGGGNFGRIYEKSTSSALFIASASNLISFRLTGVTGADFTSDANAYALDRYHHLVVTREKASGAVRFYMDAKLVGSVTGGTENTTQNSNDFYIGDNSSLTRAFDGTMGRLKLYDFAANTTWVKQRYSQVATTVLYQDSFQSSRESMGSEGGAEGGELSDTGWYFGDTTGRWTVERDTAAPTPIERVVECQTAGTLYCPDQVAYGTWEIWWYKGSDSNEPQINLLSADTTTTGSGYLLRLTSTEQVQLNRTGAAVLLRTDTSYIQHSVWYKLRVTRRTDGQFSVYLRGGTFAEWTLVDVTSGTGTNPVTDDTVTANTYMVIDADAGDRVGLVRRQLGTVNPVGWEASTGSWYSEAGGVLTNQASGVAYVPSTRAYGTWEFTLQHSGASTTRAVFLSGAIGTAGPGYYLEIDSSEAVKIVEQPGATTHFSTTTGYVAAATDYEFRITRTLAGEFTTYIRGGAYSDWTLVAADTGTNPFTDTTHTASSYFCVDLDAGDKAKNVQSFA